MHVSILGKRYRLVFERLPHRDPDATAGAGVNGSRGKAKSGEFYGDCSSPDSKNKRIRISNRLRGRHQLEITIHEVTHAANWNLDEEFVQQFGEDLSRILWRLGWRRIEDARKE